MFRVKWRQTKRSSFFFITTLQLKWISEKNTWMNQSFHGHWFISMNIFTDFTSERTKTTDFSVNTCTTDLFSENLTDPVLESTKSESKEVCNEGKSRESRFDVQMWCTLTNPDHFWYIAPSPLKNWRSGILWTNLK